MKKTLVIDGNSILNRAFYGIRPLSTKSGKPTNAIYGMLNIVLRHLEALKPDYAAVAFDLHHARAPLHERTDVPEEAILRGIRDFMCIRIDGDESPAEMRARRRHAELV